MRVRSVRALICLSSAFLLVLGIMSVAQGCIIHPGPDFPIQNQFDQPVTIYFDGHKVGRIQPGATRTFYPNEVLTKTDTDLLLEARSNSGTLLYSRHFTWAELTEVIESLRGTASFVIGPASDLTGQFWNVDSVDEAARIAGYGVATPAFLPEGFDHGRIVVQRFPGTVQRFSVTQAWISRDDPRVAFSLVQAPDLDEIGGGESAIVAGVAGQRLLLPVDADRPYPVLTLFWRKGSMAFMITGTIEGPLTEDALNTIAMSVG